MAASSLDELDIKVYIDYPQYRRNIKNPLVYIMDGTSVDASTAVNCYIEPVTRTIIGKPIPMTPEWRTTFSGTGYNRYQLTDFTFTSPTSWKNLDFYGTGDTYIYCLSNNTTILNSTISLNGGVKRNRPLFFSFIKQNKKDSNNSILAKLFWAGTDNVYRDTQLHFKDDGSCDVYRGYLLLSGYIFASNATNIISGTNTKFTSEVAVNDFLYSEDGRLIGKVASISTDTSLTLLAIANFTYSGFYHRKIPQKVASYSRNENNYNQQSPGVRNSNPNNDYNDVYIMPMRGKELVVNTSFGLNFSHSFDDLNEPDIPSSNNNFYVGTISPQGNTTPAQLFLSSEILPTGAFSIVIPNGKVAFQLANLFFNSFWEISTKPIYNEVSSRGYDNLNYKTPVIPVGLNGKLTAHTYNKTVTNTLSEFSSTNNGSRLFWRPLDDTYSLEIGTIQSTASATSLTLAANSNVYINASGSYFYIYKNTGTISFNTTTNVITGTGTNFTADLQVGFDIYDANDKHIGKVASISSATSATVFYNPFFSATNTVYWTNLPQQQYSIQKINYEYMGPATSTTASNLGGVIQLYNLQNEIADTETDNPIYLKCKFYSSSSTINDTTICLYSSEFVVPFIPNPISTTQVDITSIVENLSLERTEDGFINVDLSARKQNLIDLGITNPEKLSNRSLKITLKPRNQNYDEFIIFDGILNNPSIEYIRGLNYDKYSLLAFSGKCKKSLLNEIYFTKAPSYDDKSLLDAFYELCYFSGSLGNNDTIFNSKEISEFVLNFNRNNSNGQYNYVPVVGDSVGSFIEKLRSELSQNTVFSSHFDWYYNSYTNKHTRTLGFNLYDNASKPNKSLLDLYLNEQSAITYGSIPIEKTYKRTIRNLQKVYEAPEANQVIVVGIDKSNNDRITSIIDDVDSQNPYSTNRPNNWLGMVKTFGYVNDRLTDQKTVSKAAQSLFNRISTGREIIEFTSDFLTYFINNVYVLNPEGGVNATGTITTTTSSKTINGVGTLFSSELSINQKLYKPDGTYIGIVDSITSDTVLVLKSYAEVAISAGNYTIRPTNLYNYNYQSLDLSDAITLKNLDGTTEGVYKIISWKVDFIKENIITYTSGIANNPDTINIANASYRAVKTSISNQTEIRLNSDYNRAFANVINCVNGTAVKIIQNIETTSIPTLTTSGAPTGMTFSLSGSGSNSQDVIINWTPGATHVGNTYNVTITLSNTIGSGYSISIPLTFKVYSVL